MNWAETIGTIYQGTCVALATVWFAHAIYQYTKSTLKNSSEWLDQCRHWGQRGALEERRDAWEQEQLRKAVEGR